MAGDPLAQAAARRSRTARSAAFLASSAARENSWLLRQGLLDELHLLVFPVVLGSGKRLFEPGGGQVPLKLAGSQALSTGVLHVTCEPA